MSKIRCMLSAEYGLLDEFLYEAIYTEPGAPRPPRSATKDPALRVYVEDFGAHPGDVAVCAEEDDEVVGAAWARFMRGYGFIDDSVPELAVSVLPAWRGRGIGAALLKGLIECCSTAGLPAVSLSVQRANPAARLYERLGFHEVAGDDAEMVMVLPLAVPHDRATGDGSCSQARATDDGVSCSQACAAAMRVLTAPELAGRVALAGGLVPWVVSGHDSGRLHGDVDLTVRLEDMPTVRTWLRAMGFYEAALDSLALACNATGEDYGVHARIDDVLVSFCPYSFDDCGLHQRNAALVMTDGFDALLEALLPDVGEGDYLEERALPNGSVISCATLESVRAAKVVSGRAKDAHDIAEIDAIGYDALRFERLLAAYRAMRIVVAAHE